MIQFKDEQEKQFILQALQDNMNEEFAATLQYICHRISAKGIDNPLAESFKTAALDEMAHILFFSDLITKYGGEPEFSEWKIDTSSDIKSMLEKDIALEQKAKARYTQQIQQMKGHPDLVDLITGVLYDEEDHEKEFTGYLKKMF